MPEAGGANRESRLFFRIKPAGEHRYLQIVENTRDGSRTVQRVLASLGRVEELEADGRLDALRAIATRYDKTARNFLAAVHLAAAAIWLN